MWQKCVSRWVCARTAATRVRAQDGRVVVERRRHARQVQVVAPEAVEVRRRVGRERRHRRTGAAAIQRASRAAPWPARSLRLLWDARPLRPGPPRRAAGPLPALPGALRCSRRGHRTAPNAAHRSRRATSSGVRRSLDSGDRARAAHDVRAAQPRHLARLLGPRLRRGARK